jgi:solute carrier family 13 (sodium-dependent dicarboxylate transporter), member 2/3/5
LLFIVPKSKSKETLLNWNDTNQTPWGILFLFGGGLALARILNNGGVLDFFAEQIVALGISNMFIIILVLVVSTIFLTELMSNLALITVLVPIVAKLAETLGFDILALCLPITVAASCAFMLPMATPPNAIVFASQEIKVKDMVRTGFILNIASVFVIFGIVALYSFIKG